MENVFVSNKEIIQSNLELTMSYIDAPLTDEELVNICRASDERPKDQISVMLADQLLPPYARDGRGIYPDIPSDYHYRSQYAR